MGEGGLSVRRRLLSGGWSGGFGPDRARVGLEGVRIDLDCDNIMRSITFDFVTLETRNGILLIGMASATPPVVEQW